MKVLNIIAQVLIVIGAINWGLVAWFDFNLVSALFGVDTFLTNFIYTLVGLSGLYGLYLIAKVSQTSTTTDHRSSSVRNTDRDAPTTHDGRRHKRR